MITHLKRFHSFSVVIVKWFETQIVSILFGVSLLEDNVNLVVREESIVLRVDLSRLASLERLV
jgi:hypothetical protein